MTAKIVDSRDLVEPVEVTLKRPGADERTETIATLDIHAFKGRDMKAINGFSQTQTGDIMLAFGARITRQPVLVIEELGKADFQWVMGWVQDFLPDGLTTGATASET